MSKSFTLQTDDSSFKKEPGSYDHTERHTQVYSLNGIDASDSAIDKAWARLFDAGHNAGPAMSKPFQVDDNLEEQYFLYALAVRDLRGTNVNKTVAFHFQGGKILTESGI